MDATTSNRISRGLFAAAQGVGTMLKIRMQQANLSFRERIAMLQAEQKGMDRQQKADQFQQTYAQRDRAEAAREAEAKAAQKTRDASAQSLMQERGETMKYQQARLGMAMQQLELSKQKLAEAIQQHGDKMTSDKLKEATGALTALNQRIRNLQDQANGLQKSTTAYGASPQVTAKAQQQYDATMQSIQSLDQNAQQYTDRINTLSGVQPPVAPKKAPPKIGSKMMKLPTGSFTTLDSASLPQGVTPKEVPQGTPLNEMQPYDYFTVGAPGAIQVPNPNAPSGD